MFYGCFKQTGKKQHPLGVTDPNDIVGANAAYERKRKELEGLAPDDAAGDLGPTCAAAVGAFLEDRAAEVKPDTLKGYRKTLKPFVAHFGTLRLYEVIPGKVEAFVAGKGWSDTYRANVLNVVEQVFRFAGRKVKFRKPERESAGADSVIPEGVYEKALIACVGDWKQVIRFLWLTGCRPSEAAGLTTVAVDWPSGVVRVKDHKTKRHGKHRQLFLCPEALALLEEQRKKHGDGLLFRGKKGKPFSRQAFVMKLQRVSERIGHKITAYGFRHSYATRALIAGTPDATVAALLGHSGTTMLHRHYSHLTSQARHLKQAAAALNAKPEPPPTAA